MIKKVRDVSKVLSTFKVISSEQKTFSKDIFKAMEIVNDTDIINRNYLKVSEDGIVIRYFIRI